MTTVAAPARSLRSLRLKVLGAIGLTILLLLGLLFVPLREIILNNFARLEQDSIATMLKQYQSAIQARETNLASAVHDYANWDDAYEYAQTGDPTFTNETLVASTYVGLNVQLIVILDRNGNVLYGQSFNPTTSAFQEIPRGFFDDYSARLQELPTTQSSVIGLVQVQQNIMLIAAQPIVTTEGQGPVQGTFIMGRTLNSTLVEQLNKETLITGSIISLINGTELTPQAQGALTALEAGADNAIPLDDDSFINGYALLKGLQGRPLALLRITDRRPILEQANQTLLYAMIAVVLAGLIQGIVVMILLQKLVLKRILRQHTTMQKMTANPDQVLRLPAAGNDEIGALSASINSTLDAIADAQQQRRASDAEREQLQAALIDSQSATLAKLSSPLIPVTEQILVLPLIGSLDAARSERIISTTLQGLKSRQAKVAIIDLTGLEAVDAQVPHLLSQLAQSAHIIGARVMLTGMRADIARVLIEHSAMLTKIPAFTTLQQGIAAAIAAHTKRDGAW